MFIRYKHHIFPFKVVIDRMVKWYGGSILVIGKKRLIIYGLGKIFEKNKKEIDWDQVVALTDKQINQSTEQHPISQLCEIIKHIITQIHNNSHNDKAQAVPHDLLHQKKGRILRGNQRKGTVDRNKACQSHDHKNTD